MPRYEKLRAVREKPTSRNRTHFDQLSHFKIGRLSGSISVECISLISNHDNTI
jgi:hypothetical protein